MSFHQILSLCHFVLVLSLLIFASQDLQLGEVAVHDIGESTLPFISPLTFGLCRLFCALVVWCTLLWVTFTRKPLFLTVMLRNGDLKMVSLIHTQRYSMFTVWSWTLQGYYFLMAAYCSFCIHFRAVNDASSSLKPYFVEPSVTFCFITWVLFEVCFPIAFLVSSIVTFVLIPHAKKANLPTDNFYVIIPLIMHNANILFMALEIIANQIPFSVWHFPFLWIYGIAYCVFSWIWNHYYGYYFYFFLDYTRPGAIVWYIALLSIVGFFFSVGVAASYLMISHGDTYVPAFIILAITGLVVKLAD